MADFMEVVEKVNQIKKTGLFTKWLLSLKDATAKEVWRLVKCSV
ncbi:hypothetical protein Q7469_00930 [Glaesserella parasuis]|uniref:Uncharacterized protein n=1 Tax=Glaesserella parasuis TaxID=738 RepID=A0AAJ6AD21_GLAPU|nr:hypothetical protein [Glaesserella parasuis]EQA04653.1 hypothetical protein HPSSW114_0056 [Glaesserella parasuis SW114]EQA11224.1 hypothetical protein HPSD74_0225 [Glaesserella parasuis D74]MDD2165839.1 hypothetical protein [Glaesserella parasuis]MDD2172648.1 hypothetical protein [Glaesserella parasuis]MDG6229887.1 hypothetical protein [Glaesserella parasuis]